MEKGGEEVKIMPEGIEQYIKKLASDAYLNLERSDMHGARVRVLQILAVIKENKIKKQFEEIYDSAEQIIRLFEEANFRMAEELLLSIFGKKELSSKEFEKRKRELIGWSFKYNLYPDLGNFLIQHWEGTVEMAEAARSLYNFFESSLSAFANAGIINERTWPEILKGLIEIAEIAEKKKNYTFAFGLSAVAETGIINERTWPEIVKGLIEIAKAAGYNENHLFVVTLPAIAKAGLINEKTWPGLIEMARAAGENVDYLFKCGLLVFAKAGIINERTWPEIVKRLIEMVRAAGENANYFFIRLSGVKDIINEQNWYQITNIILDLCKEWPDIFRNKELYLSYIIKKLSGEELTKENFVRMYLKENFGFIPEGDIEGLLKFAITDFSNDEKVLIASTFSKKITKEFPLGKVYDDVHVRGIAKLSDPVELVDVLVTVLLAQKKKGESTIQEMLKDPKYERYIRFLKKYSTGRQLFDFNKLQAARKYIQTSDINPNKVFQDIKNDFNAVRSLKDKAAAERIIDYFTQIAQRGKAEKVEPLADIVMGIKSLFGATLRFNHVIAKMQSGVVTDLFDSKNTMCCAFYPDGVNKKASIGYIEDPYIGLLQLKAAIKEILGKPKEIEIIGVAILVLCTDQNNNIVLLVDSVEGNGEYLNCMSDKQWKELFFNSLQQVKKDVNAKYVVYNKEVGNTTPNRFNDFLSEKGFKEVTVKLKKTGSLDKRYLEAFGGWETPYGNVTGFYVE